MNKIKQLREEKAMTQYQLGKCLNVQNTTISMYEREERQLDTPTINKLCSVLECTSDYLLGRSEVRDPVISNEDALWIKAWAVFFVSPLNFHFFSLYSNQPIVIYCCLYTAIALDRITVQ